VNLKLPEEVVEALGPEPERAALEAVPLSLISEDKMPVAQAGGFLRHYRISAIHWYTSYVFYYPDLSEENLAEELRYAREQ
jgi:hypothetical protein